jgi:hypothetical protein
MKKLLARLPKYRKFLVAAGTVILAGLVQTFGATNQYVALAIGLAGSFGVFLTPNAR